MLNRISISQHPIEFVIHQIGNILPGIEEVKTYYFDERDFRVKLSHFNKGEITFPPIDESKLHIIQKHRGNSQKYEWLKENFELFKSENQNNFQISIEDIAKQNLLCLRFENPIDHLFDIIFIHLNGKVGTLKLSLDNENIKEDEKSIVERLIHNSISFILDNERNNKKLYQNVISNVETLKDNNNLLKKEVTDKSDSYQKSISYFCTSYVYKIAKQENVSISITKDAINKIIIDAIPFDKLEPLLRQTIEMCLNRTLDLSENILIDEFDLVIPKKTVSNHNHKEEQVVISDRYAKTKEYLDRYEVAAEELLKNGLSLTGINIGTTCTPKITPAAISDNIKKHRSKIITLLNRYQEKWPIIRENYRPIRKLLDNTNNDNIFKTAV